MHFAMETVFEGNLQRRNSLLEMVLEVEVCQTNPLNQQVEYYSYCQ